jgi:DNA repair exonuclease SbcCD ATPase subunit
MENEEEKKEDVRGQIEGILTELQTVRDEIRVRIHLAGMELKDTWKDIETRIEDFENKKPEASHMVRDAAAELREAFRSLRAKLP